MNLERMREFLLSLEHVVETEQFGGLVYWVGDKAVGGKMFAMLNPDGGDQPVSFMAGAEHFADLVERDGFRPAPYLARVFWVGIERWDVFRAGEWQQEMAASHVLTLAKLSPKTKKVLALPPTARRKAVSDARKLLAPKS